MSKFFWGGYQDEQNQQIPGQSSGYFSSLFGSQNSYYPSTLGSSSSNDLNVQKPSNHPESSSSSHGQFSPNEAASIIGLLKNKSVDELKKLESDKGAYNKLLRSLEMVKVQDKVRDDLVKGTLQIARENMEKEPLIFELQNQCRIIRTTELAAAQEKLNALERQKEECLRGFSTRMLLQKLQESMVEAEEESENLQRQLLEKEIQPAVFVQKSTSLRKIYQKRALTLLAAKVSSSG